MTLRARHAVLLALLLAGCSPGTPPTEARPGAAPAQAEIDRFIAQGPEPTLRRIVAFDYLAHYRVMEATGMVQALGGEQRALAALEALGQVYERRLRGAQAEVPRRVPAAFDGSAMDSGFVGMGVGAFGGLIAGGMTSTAASSMSDAELAELARQGPIQLGGEDGGFQVSFDESGAVDQTIEFEGKVAEGLTGKVKVQIHMDACPDAQGKLDITIKVESQMGVDGKPGMGGFVRAEFRMQRYLDDDAHLIGDDGSAAEMTMTAGGSQGGRNQSFEARMGYGRGGAGAHQEFGNEQGFSIFHMDEVQHAADLANQSFRYLQLVAEMMLRGIGKGGGPWESGRCVDVQASSSPGKRKGARPDTAYDIEVRPRARADGAPTGGSVRATLSGGRQLTPSSGKVPADAQYQYANPDRKDESASIAFEARSKRGVGRASLDFDTRRRQAYAAAGGLDDFHGTGTICDLGEPFTISGSGNTVSFTPTGDNGGTYTYAGSMGGVGVHGSGTWSASADDSGGTLTGTGNGCVDTPMGTYCNGGTEVYALTPIEPCEDG